LVAASASKLREVVSGRAVPSAEIIAAKRQQRDTDWGNLRATLFGSSEALTGDRLVEIVASFERHSSEADKLADSAASDAVRVAAYAVETNRLAEESRKEAEAKTRIAALESSLLELSKAWTAGWAPTGIATLHPSEMAAWRSAVEGLLDRREKLENLRDEFAAVDVAVRSIEPALRALAAEAGLRDIEVADISIVATRFEDWIRSISQSWEKARDLDTRIRDAQHRIEKLNTTEAQLTRKLEEWSARWSVALPTISMPATTTLDEAEAALVVWKDVPGTIRERNNRAQRVAGMRRNIESFEHQAQHFLRDIAPDLGALPTDVAVKMLNDRLAAARAAETRWTESRRRLAEITRAREEADAALAKAEAELAALATKLPPHTDLSDLLRRLTERDKILNVVKERRTQLTAQAEGHDEDKLRADLADFNADEVEAALTMLAEEEETLEREAQEVFAAHRQAVRERAAAEQGIGAEVAAQQRSSAAAELASVSREWVVLKLGALLIGAAIDRRRASQHDPLMARAGALFATLTGGRFAGIGQDYDASDMPHLVGRRPAGEMIPVTGMSTGARDQLYLALRLAYLEAYASRAEPAPFIGDDLFATFDEDRTANGLAALAAIGDQIQPIVFTHHRHVAEIAHTKLDADVILLPN
jgi:uncharacterized protein YhaN